MPIATVSEEVVETFCKNVQCIQSVTTSSVSSELSSVRDAEAVEQMKGVFTDDAYEADPAQVGCWSWMLLILISMFLL